MNRRVSFGIITIINKEYSLLCLLTSNKRGHSELVLRLLEAQLDIKVNNFYFIIR